MFTKFCAAISKICLVLAVIGLIAVILCVQWQVIGRYVLNDTPTWAEALATPGELRFTRGLDIAGVVRGAALQGDGLAVPSPG